MVHNRKRSELKQTSSGTDKASLSHPDILSLENEKATLLICIGVFLHLLVETKTDKMLSLPLLITCW